MELRLSVDLSQVPLDGALQLISVIGPFDDLSAPRVVSKTFLGEN